MVEDVMRLMDHLGIETLHLVGYSMGGFMSNKFLAEHPDFQLEPPPAGTVPESTIDAGILRVIPQRHGADGYRACRRGSACRSASA